MADQHTGKKRKISPAIPPREHKSRSPSVTRGSHTRRNNLPNAGKESTPSLGRSSVEYPTPSSANCIPHSGLFKASSNRIPSLQTETPSTPRSARIIVTASSSDSNEVEIVQEGSPKQKKESAARADSNGGEGCMDTGESSTERKGKGKSKVPLELDSDSDKEGSDGESDEEEGSNAGGEGSDEDEAPPKKKSKVASSRFATPKVGPSTSKAGRKAKVEDEEVEVRDITAKIVPAFNTKVIKSHVLKCVLRACGLDRAQDAGSLVPQLDDAGRPIHFVKGLFVPHLGRTFESEWKDWKGDILKLFKDPSQMDSEHEAMLLTVSDADFRKAVKDGVFATMKGAWTKHQTGKGKEWLEAKKNASKQWVRKKQKADNRMTALVRSGLEVERYKYVANVGYQSVEEDDPDDSSCRIVKVPEHRSDDAELLRGALDTSFNANKSHPGNQQCTTYKYVKVNVKVPKLNDNKPAATNSDSGDQDLRNYVPKWAVSAAWMAANPDLERESRGQIDPDDTNVPDREKFRKFVHRYEPTERTYPSAPIVPASTFAPVASESETIAEDTTATTLELTGIGEADPDLAAADIPGTGTLDAAAHIPGSASYSPSGALDTQPLADSVDAPTGPVTPAAPPAPTESRVSTQPSTTSHAPNPTFGPQSSYAPTPSFPPPFHASNAPVQPTLVQMPNGKMMWAYPCVQPLAQNEQGDGLGAAYMGNEIDPGLDESTQQYQPNDMPPPPSRSLPQNLERVAEQPEQHELASKLRKRKKTSGEGGSKVGPQRGAKVGTRGGSAKRGRPAKSRAIIDDEDDEEDPEGEVSIAGPSQGGSGKAKKS